MLPGSPLGARPGGRGVQGALTRAGEQVTELIAALFLAHFVPKLASIGKPAPSLGEPLRLSLLLRDSAMVQGQGRLDRGHQF